MTLAIVDNLEPEIKTVLMERAILHGLTMEEEARQILRNAVGRTPPPQPKLGTRIAGRFAGIGLSDPLIELNNQTINPMSFGA